MEAAGAADADAALWQDLPLDVLQLLGSLLSCPSHVSAASRVCRAWHAALPAGVQALELDMNPSLEAWAGKVEQLGQLTPRVSSVAAHVSTAVSRGHFAANLRALARKLHHVQHLNLRLSEGFELELAAGDELSELSALRSLTLSGGVFNAASAERLLACLAEACPQLEELHVLPEARCGLGDDQVALLVRLPALKVLEFRAYRLTAAGLTALAAQLPALEVLSCHGLDTCLDAATAHVFASRPSLRELHLGCDYELPETTIQQLRNVAGDLSMKFRWTDKLTGLLRTARLHLQARLVRLDLGCVRLAKDPATALIEPLAALTALSDLRMSVHSNTDATVTLNLSELTALSNLQVLHVSKQHAYFPEQRRMAESSIAVPLSAATAAALAAGCSRLRSLRLCLGHGDVTPEGLAALRRFSGLRSLSVSAEPFGRPHSQPVPLDLLDLPPHLTALELRGVDIVTSPAALATAAVAGDACGVLRDLAVVRLESVRLRTPQLQMLVHALPAIQQLKLAHVAGLTDAGVTCLARLTGLRELSVLGPQNKALSQAGLATLAPLRELRYLSWETDDLKALGPVMAAFTSFTTLRRLSLSCTPATLSHSCTGGPGAFRQLLPYCHLDLIC